MSTIVHHNSLLQLQHYFVFHTSDLQSFMPYSYANGMWLHRVWREIDLKWGQKNYTGAMFWALTAPCVTHPGYYREVRCGNSKQSGRRNAQRIKTLFRTIHHDTQSSAWAQISTFLPHFLFHKQVSGYPLSTAMHNPPSCGFWMTGILAVWNWCACQRKFY